MKHKNILVYELILLIFTIFTKFYNSFECYNYVLCAFWIISVLLLYKILGFRRKNIKIKKDVIQITIICIMFYILGTYLSGLVLGFLKNPYSLELKTVFENIYPLVIMIGCQELIRFMIGGKDKVGLIVLTILFSLFDFIYYSSSGTFSSIYLGFVFITATYIPIVARHVVSSYLSRQVTYIPGLILRLYFGVSVMIIPIFPDIGNFLTSVFGVLLPYVIYFITSKMIVKAEKERIPRINKKMYYLYVPLICGLLFVVALASGFFKYHMIAIASGSMEPTFYRGDAIIYEKTKDISTIKNGTAIVFEHDGKYISHRIVSIEKKNNEYVIQTKGDNNPENDNYQVSMDKVKGVIKRRIKWIGYPTVWFSELIS